MTTKELFEEYARNSLYVEQLKQRSVDNNVRVRIIKELEANIRKEVLNEMLEFLKEPEEYCLQHYGYATDKQEDEIYTQGMQDFKAYKIIKLLNRIK